MKIYTLHRKQFLPIDLQKAWDFFSSPKNLGEITPKHMKFTIVSLSGGDKMHEGQIIKYKITVLPLIRVTWITEITRVNNRMSFTDEQRVGPYAQWHHTHIRGKRRWRGNDRRGKICHPAGATGSHGQLVFCGA